MKDEIVLLDRFSRITESAEPYPVDFDDAWQWIGYSTKQKAREALERNFEENFDFLTTRLKSTGGRPGDGYFLTVDCFKAFCMMAGTEKGKEVRQYYLAIEKKYRELQHKAFNQEAVTEAIREEVSRAIGEKLAFLSKSDIRKRLSKADRDEEIRQEVAAFVEKHLEFTENWRDVLKECDMYVLFKEGCIEKNPIPKYAFHNQLRLDFPQAVWGRDKQDVVIWHNLRFKGEKSG
jgi:phage anti-repressor protein